MREVQVSDRSTEDPRQKSLRARTTREAAKFQITIVSGKLKENSFIENQ